MSSNLRDCEHSRGRRPHHAPTLGNACHALGGCTARIRVSRGLCVQRPPLMKELPSVERRCLSASPLPTGDRYCTVCMNARVERVLLSSSTDVRIGTTYLTPLVTCQPTTYCMHPIPMSPGTNSRQPRCTAMATLIIIPDEHGAHILESGSHENDCAVGRPPTLNHQSTAGIASDVDISTLEEHDVRKRCECLINFQAYNVSCDDNQRSPMRTRTAARANASKPRPAIVDDVRPT